MKKPLILLWLLTIAGCTPGHIQTDQIQIRYENGHDVYNLKGWTGQDEMSQADGEKYANYYMEGICKGQNKDYHLEHVLVLPTSNLAGFRFAEWHSQGYCTDRTTNE